MGQETGIGWTDHTGNFWGGCVKVSEGCANCYAEALVVRGRMQLPVWGPPSTTARHRFKGAWEEVKRWDRAAGRDGVRRRLFVSSLADIFEDHPQVAPWRAEALTILASLRHLDVQCLTKRPENITRMVPPAWLAPGEWPAHVWVGCTVENQRRANERIPELLKVPARVRFLSCEPLLEDLGDLDLSGIDLVILGGESGPGARPCDVRWIRRVMAQCREQGVSVFVKQLGANVPTTEWGGGRLPQVDERGGARTWALRDPKGGDPAEWPEDLRVRELPQRST